MDRDALEMIWELVGGYGQGPRRDFMGRNHEEQAKPPYALRMCGQCAHWFAVPSAGLEIQTVKTGQCRQSPPSAQILNAQQNVALYPHLPENFGACSKFESLLSLGMDKESPPLDLAPRRIK
jgi:hypothetical protein